MRLKNNTRHRKKSIQGLRSFKDSLPKNIKETIFKKAKIYSKIVDNCKKYNTSEIAFHNKSNDCWISVNGDIYNLNDLKNYYKNNSKKIFFDGIGYTHIADDKKYKYLKKKVNNNEKLNNDEKKFYNNMTKYLTLYPGDVVWMGTDDVPIDIKDGDVVDVEITGIGTLSNPVKRSTE